MYFAAVAIVAILNVFDVSNGDLVSGGLSDATFSAWTDWEPPRHRILLEGRVILSGEMVGRLVGEAEQRRLLHIPALCDDSRLAVGFHVGMDNVEEAGAWRGSAAAVGWPAGFTAVVEAGGKEQVTVTAGRCAMAVAELVVAVGGGMDEGERPPLVRLLAIDEEKEVETQVVQISPGSWPSCVGSNFRCETTEGQNATTAASSFAQIVHVPWRVEVSSGSESHRQAKLPAEFQTVLGRAGRRFLGLDAASRAHPHDVVWDTNCFVGSETVLSITLKFASGEKVSAEVLVLMELKMVNDAELSATCATMSSGRKGAAGLGERVQMLDEADGGSGLPLPIRVEQTIGGKGAHRTLETRLAMRRANTDDNEWVCDVSVMHALPRELFVDADELKEWNRRPLPVKAGRRGAYPANETQSTSLQLTNVEARVLHPVDVEKPSFMAPCTLFETAVHIIAAPRRRISKLTVGGDGNSAAVEEDFTDFVTTSVPIHMRYQRPVADGASSDDYFRQLPATVAPYRTAVLFPPVVFQRCVATSGEEKVHTLSVKAARWFASEEAANGPSGEGLASLVFYGKESQVSGPELFVLLAPVGRMSDLVVVAVASSVLAATGAAVIIGALYMTSVGTRGDDNKKLS